MRSADMVECPNTINAEGHFARIFVAQILNHVCDAISATAVAEPKTVRPYCLSENILLLASNSFGHESTESAIDPFMGRARQALSNNISEMDTNTIDTCSCVCTRLLTKGGIYIYI